MGAPSIILVGVGDDHPRVHDALQAIRAKLGDRRPDLDVHLGLVAGDPQHPGILDVVQEVASGPTAEIALIPMDLVSAAEHNPLIADSREVARQTCADVRVVVSRPIGPATELLNILDSRVRKALSRSGAVEVDALVLSTPQGGDVRGASLLARRARQWAGHHRVPVQLAVNDETGHGTANAIAALRSQGRRHIAVGSMFLTGGRLWQAQRESALRMGAIAVSDPIADDDQLVELVLARYAFAAMELLDLGTPADDEFE